MKRIFLKDSVINIISVILPLIILQLYIYPSIAKQLGPEEYGYIITLISIILLISLPIGNSVNNIRLLKGKDLETGKELYFIFILKILLLIGFFLFVTIVWFLNIKLNLGLLIIMLIVIGLGVFREYLLVYLRIKINYKYVLLNNILLTIGYCLGYLVFYYTSYWIYIFLIGYILAIFQLTIFIIQNKYSFLFKIDKNEFKKYFSDSLNLTISNYLKNVLQYADKIILFPLIGGHGVAVYYAASSIGKLILMFISPVSNVLLSYLVKANTLKKKSFLKIYLYILILSVFVYLLTVIISPSIIELLYPSFFKESNEYIAITSLSAIIIMINGLLYPFSLKYNRIETQLYLNFSQLFFFAIISLYMVNEYGLYGYCISLVLVNIYKMILTTLFIFRRL